MNSSEHSAGTVKCAFQKFTEEKDWLERGYDIQDWMALTSIAFMEKENLRWVVGSGCIHSFKAAIFDTYSMMAREREDFSYEYQIHNRFCGIPVVLQLSFLDGEPLINDGVYLLMIEEEEKQVEN